MTPTRKIWVLCVHLTPVALSVTAVCALGVWVTGKPIHPPTAALMTVVGFLFTFWSACFDRGKSWHEAMGWKMRPTVETLRAAGYVVVKDVGDFPDDSGSQRSIGYRIGWNACRAAMLSTAEGDAP